MKRKVIHVELKAAVIAEPDELVNFVQILGRAEWSHTHDFVFAFVDLKAQKGGKGTVKKTHRMWEADFF